MYLFESRIFLVEFDHSLNSKIYFIQIFSLKNPRSLWSFIAPYDDRKTLASIHIQWRMAWKFLGMSSQKRKSVSKIVRRILVSSRDYNGKLSHWGQKTLGQQIVYKDKLIIDAPLRQCRRRLDATLGAQFTNKLHKQERSPLRSCSSVTEEN